MVTSRCPLDLGSIWCSKMVTLFVSFFFWPFCFPFPFLLLTGARVRFFPPMDGTIPYRLAKSHHHRATESNEWYNPIDIMHGWYNPTIIAISQSTQLVTRGMSQLDLVPPQSEMINSLLGCQEPFWLQIFFSGELMFDFSGLIVWFTMVNSWWIRSFWGSLIFWSGQQMKLVMKL